jgi:hypothetical protein
MPSSLSPPAAITCADAQRPQKTPNTKIKSVSFFRFIDYAFGLLGSGYMFALNVFTLLKIHSPYTQVHITPRKNRGRFVEGLVGAKATTTKSSLKMAFSIIIPVIHRLVNSRIILILAKYTANLAKLAENLSVVIMLSNTF